MVIVRKQQTTTQLPARQPAAFVSLGLLLSHAFHGVIFTICAKSAYNFEDATRAMAFYGVYHREPWNQLIHFFGVPFILWTMLVFAAHLPISNTSQIDFLPGVEPHYVTWAELWFLLYSVFYYSIDVTGAVLFTPLLYMMYATSINWTIHDQRLYQESDHSISPSWMGSGQLLRLALILHIFSWYLQIHAGHKIIEGAQPASLANLGGALTTAPLFAFFEGVWFMGFRKDFQMAVIKQVGKYTEELCAQGTDMRVCTTL